MSEKKEFQFNLPANTAEGEPKPQTVIILEGEAEKIIYPLTIVLGGALTAPGLFVDHLRTHNLLEANKHIILVNRDARSIVFNQDLQSQYGAKVTGKLELDAALSSLGINGGTRYTREELYSFIRMNRHAFPNQDAYLILLNSVKKFEATVNKDIQAADDNKGNKTRVNNQTVNTNIPFDFTLKTRIFKGYGFSTFNVEVMLDISDAGTKFWLESPELKTFIQLETERLMDEEIKTKFEGLTVIYQ